MVQTYIGASITRKEDVRFLTGRATYTDDLKAHHLLHAAILRSPHPHARILSIDGSRALELPGVVAVFTFKDIAETVEPRRIPIRVGTNPELDPFLQFPLARDKVRFVGEAVAVAVAESRSLAEDALERIDVRYEPLPPVVDVEDSLTGESLLFEEHGSNAVVDYTMEIGDADEAFRTADYTRKERFRCHRHTGNPLETRGLMASYDTGRDELTVWGETKVPHFNRGVLSHLLQMPEHRIHFVEPDIGGGFGVRGEFYPENFLVPFASIKLGRPVKWMEDRREHLLGSNHSREHVCEIEIAAKSDGTLLGMRARILGALGGYVRTHGAFIPMSTAGLLMGPYHFPSYQWQVVCLLTNKTGMGTFSAPGRYESCYFRERMLDIVAGDLGIDPAELRLKNLLQPSDMPHTVGVTRPGMAEMIYDSGNYPQVLREALSAFDYDSVKGSTGKQEDGRYTGVGVACFVKSTGTGPSYEGARVVVNGPDQVAVYLGVATLGQGHETTMAQICADGLGVPLDYVTIYHGNTDFMPYGGGTFASRATVMAGNALYMAAQEMKQKVLRIAAGFLDVDPSELEFVQGNVIRRGSDIEGPLMELGRVLDLASPNSRYNQGEMGLEVTATFHLGHESFPYGTHACQVAVDIETGKIEVQRYVVVEDVGHVINPLIVHGQAIGAIAQGIGATILEDLPYDAAGQPLATTFMDYLLPTSTETPKIECQVLDLAPSPLNPLGVKGAGEVGIVATGAVLSNAVSNALAEFGIQVRDLPLSPDRIRAMVREADGPSDGT